MRANMPIMQLEDTVSVVHDAAAAAAAALMWL
jgi:hypothetical protein